MPTDLRLVTTFVETARRLSFTGAAKALGLTPGSVSQNIRNLEEQLGVRLLTRTTRQVRLTTEGARYLARCAPALEALVEAETAVREERERLTGRLRVTSTTAFGRAQLLPVIAGFMQAHPGIEVELSLSDQFVDLVAEGFDLAIRGGILPENEYISRLILPVTPLVCASPAYAEAHGLPRTLPEIATHRLIGMRSNPSQQVLGWEFAAPGGGVQRIEIAPALAVNDPEGVALAAAAGIGLGQVGSNVVLPLVTTGRLVLALTEHAVRSRGIYAVYPSRRFVPRRLSLFVQALADAFAQRADLVWQPAAAPVPTVRRQQRR
ncbi:LysR family transcriptional regulator [Roseomonas fluvialis]|uniref:LysR family transcriptional regulator n=1 Tax=Roseomonas fluvialis TaxID=1750527 RepID=A0ABM7Y8N4_9PROT|nr:LysR family transcriptional regulator [Roseomonas fluvialis]BDG74413.1 LysR family transcriptional regulator [Roseomonas fluvialis]